MFNAIGNKNVANCSLRVTNESVRGILFISRIFPNADIVSEHKVWPKIVFHITVDPIIFDLARNYQKFRN